MDSYSFANTLQTQIQQLKTHPHIEQVVQIQPRSYRINYWPQNLDSIYAQKSYFLKLAIPQNFPDQPPKLYFIDKMYHLNVHPNSGEVFMSLLKDDWSPYIRLKSIFQTLDSVLQEGDQTFPATKGQLNQYQNQIQKYIQKVKRSLNIEQQKIPIQLHNQSNEEVVQQIIEVTEYLKQNKNIKQSPRGKNKNKKQSQQNKAQSLGQTISQVQKNQEQKMMFIQDEFVQNKTDKQIKNIPKQFKQQSKTKNDSMKDFQKIMKESSDIKNQTFQKLKQALIKSNELMQIFTQQCEIIENRVNKTLNVKIKKVMQQKVVTLQNTIIQLFQLSSGLNVKILQILKKECKSCM